MKTRIFLKFCLTGISFLAFFVVVAALFKPSDKGDIKEYSAEEIEEAERLRATDFDFSNPPVVNQTVDYSEGIKAAWYPKGEAPILEELVNEGLMPPVAERVGPEPVVMMGPDGLGNYGGTWLRGTNAPRNVESFGTLYSDTQLVRWSPLGHPIVPHVAKSYEILDGGRTYLFHLRKGIRWSDGELFTADDILYWWEHEANDKGLGRDTAGLDYKVLEFRGKLGRIRKVDDYTVRFEFDEPNGIFLNRLATHSGSFLTGSPAHYLKQFHPKIGDQDLIKRLMELHQVPSPSALYVKMKDWDNVEHPRLWAFLYRNFTSSQPYVWVRNPYYFAVDAVGRQLPYLDRVLYTIKSKELLDIAAVNGEFSLQAALSPSNYSMGMEMRDSGGYDLYHYTNGGGTSALIFPNMNLRVEPGDKIALMKRELLRNNRFKQALSLAINREDLIEVNFSGMGEAVQAGPGPKSLYHEPSQYYAYTDFDTDRANRILDEIGLLERDNEGFRTFRDGSRMHFHLNLTQGTGLPSGFAEGVVDDWALVGVRATARERSTNLFRIEFEGLQHDFTFNSTNGQFLPLNAPRCYTIMRGAWYASAWARWFDLGGYYGKEVKLGKGVQVPPEDHPIMDAVRIYDRAIQTADIQEQADIFRDALKIAAEQMWTIGITESPPLLIVVKRGFRNVPREMTYSWDMLGFGGAGRETFFFDEPYDSPGAIAQVKKAMIEPTLPPRISASLSVENDESSSSWEIIGLAFRFVLLVGLIALIFLIAIRHPFIGRRILIMVPTLLFISVVVFTIIQLPPGDYVTTLVSQLEVLGEEADMRKIEDLKTFFKLDKSIVDQYLYWTGLKWFITFSPEDTGLLQGNLGRSMETRKLVNDMIGDRLLLTIFISLGTILFTWMVALPIGIFSAVRQYSIGDYIATFIGFLGMCIPNFLLALLLMFFASKFLGIHVTGLFSSEYGAQPEWSWGKFVDLLKHIWLPILVLGVTGTTGMIRVMRGNLLDELKKPYVVTARAKGVRPLKLLLKYPVRLALNPFISSIGVLFPQLISGGAIVAMILSLPTIGPQMIYALTNEDMYLAGTLLMLLSTLGVVGTLVSDILLMALDPRIRMSSGGR
jgi:ABC-type dipeptide/oligopeptide/nickel transport system permease component/ABC-type transport system substrate-binding protein